METADMPETLLKENAKQIDLDQILHKVETYGKQLQGKGAFDVVDWALAKFGHSKVVLSSALGPETQIITHHLAKTNKSARIAILDTGRLFQETYDLIQECMEKYGIIYEVYAPDPDDIAKRALVFSSRYFGCHCRYTWNHTGNGMLEVYNKSR